jgi:SAM-dependent methyltransferase
VSVWDRAIERVARARAPKEPPVPVGAEVVADSIFERPSCPACGNTRGDVVLEASDTWVHRDYGGQRFAVVRCAICALRYTSPRLKRSHKRIAFEGDYPFYTRAKIAKDGVIPDRTRARAPFEGRARRLTAIAPTPGRLLDVGCGDGFFCDAMRLRGWDTVGVDIDDDVLWHARDRLALDVHKIDVDEDRLPEGPFEAVTMWGLLQLCYDPRRVLEEARRVLAPEGVLAIGVSNFKSAGASLFGKSWRGLGLPRHLMHFTPESLARLVEWCGFEVVELSFETPRWIVAGSVDAALGAAPVKKAAKAALYALGGIVGRTARADTMELYARSTMS